MLWMHAALEAGIIGPRDIDIVFEGAVDWSKVRETLGLKE